MPADGLQLTVAFCAAVDRTNVRRRALRRSSPSSHRLLQKYRRVPVGAGQMMQVSDVRPNVISSLRFTCRWLTTTSSTGSVCRAESNVPQQQPAPLFRGMAAPAAQNHTTQLASPMQAQVQHHGPRASSRHGPMHMVGMPSGIASSSRSMPTLARTEEELAPRQHVGAWHTARMWGPSRRTESPAKGSLGAPMARLPASERSHARRDGLAPVGHQTHTVKKE